MYVWIGSETQRGGEVPDLPARNRERAPLQLACDSDSRVTDRHRHIYADIKQASKRYLNDTCRLN